MAYCFMDSHSFSVYSVLGGSGSEKEVASNKAFNPTAPPPAGPRVNLGVGFQHEKSSAPFYVRWARPAPVLLFI